MVTLCHSRYLTMKLNLKEMFEQKLNTPVNSDIGYFLEDDLIYPSNIRQKTKQFPFCPEKKSISKDDINEHMKKIKPQFYIPHKELICDWTDKKSI